MTLLQAYSVTKAALLHLLKTLAKISGPEIRVNSVSAGILLTVSLASSSSSYDRASKLIKQDWGRRFSVEKLNTAKEKSVLKRLATVDVSLNCKILNLRKELNVFKDVVGQILCLAQSQSITGYNAVIDAGWSLG